MNQKQYIRLSIVLAVPTLAFSLYLGQHDVFQERGQFVQCSVSDAICSPMMSTSYRYHQLYEQVRYYNHSKVGTLALYNIDVPMKVYIQTIDSKMMDISHLVDSKFLEKNNCDMFTDNTISCSNMFKVFPTLLAEGRVEFINPEDEIAFNTIVEEGESYFEDYTLNRIFEGLLLFLIFATPYLIFSWLVHFIIYGARIGSQKKRPYQ